ncbi:hypothetical protein [Prosthecobacter sp.]|uniref:hypothetical protein n=1 Tax=Prosthecobacter sp. TaxID=1965333 RepID=UPI0037839F9E
MSQPDPSKKAGATFTWVLGAFAGFAVLFILIQSITASRAGYDPRAQERSANTAEIQAAQAKSIASLGLNDSGRKKAVFEKTVSELGAKKSGVSTQVVPGSPTQLKQAAAAAAPAPAPAAPAPPVPAPAPPPVPAPAPAAAPAVPPPAVPAAPAPAPAAPALPK